ncbi:MAG: helix-turn-helix domain-containing protein [Oscillatoriales cyanobacterium SM2_1_8]|nr:helix-turn-helix domain-containing protein [Oscillatoriales cyanobacterium SM2_1_8]
MRAPSPFALFASVSLIVKAADLLQDSQFGIREIAAQVAYTSEVSFSKTFKKWVGTAPGIYRRKCRTGNNLLESSAV